MLTKVADDGRRAAERPDSLVGRCAVGVGRCAVGVNRLAVAVRLCEEMVRRCADAVSRLETVRCAGRRLVDAVGRCAGRGLVAAGR